MTLLVNHIANKEASRLYEKLLFVVSGVKTVPYPKLRLRVVTVHQPCRIELNFISSAAAV